MSTPCGCLTNVAPPYETPVYVSTAPCPEGTPCEETYKAECEIYTGPNLPAVGITNGMSVKAAFIALYKAVAPTTTDPWIITVATGQTPTTVEYVNAGGSLVKIVVSSLQSPQTITARRDTPVKLSGTGTLQLAL